MSTGVFDLGPFLIDREIRLYAEPVGSSASAIRCHLRPPWATGSIRPGEEDAFAWPGAVLRTGTRDQEPGTRQV